MVSSRCRDIERVSKMSKKKAVEQSRQQRLATKYQISKHLQLPILLKLFPKRVCHTGLKLRYFFQSNFFFFFEKNGIRKKCNK